MKNSNDVIFKRRSLVFKLNVYLATTSVLYTLLLPHYLIKEKFSLLIKIRSKVSVVSACDTTRAFFSIQNVPLNTLFGNGKNLLKY